MLKPYFDDGRSTIYCGKAEEVLPEIGGGIALTVTSPPYNTLAGLDGAPEEGAEGGWSRISGTKRRMSSARYEDERDEDEYEGWMRGVATGVLHASKPGASFFFNHKCRWRDGVLWHPYDLVKSFEGWRVLQEIIWDRPGSPIPGSGKFAVNDERIYWLVDPRERFVWNQRVAGFLTVWRMSPPAREEHPCPFPITIPERAILATTKPGDLVLDPFMGRGTTLHAARALGRRGVGIDVDEAYCELAARSLR